jgi:hypothetical protein
LEEAGALYGVKWRVTLTITTRHHPPIRLSTRPGSLDINDVELIFGRVSNATMQKGGRSRVAGGAVGA